MTKLNSNRTKLASMALVLAIGLAACDASVLFDLDDSNASIVSTDTLQADGPMGFEMGMPKSKFSDLEEVSFNKFSTELGVRKNPFVEFFRVSFAPSGLCAFGAYGRDIKSSPDGEEIKSEIRRLREALAKKYGQPDYTELKLSEESELTAITDWMSSVASKERVHKYCWLAEEGQDYPHNVESICLDAIVIADTGYAWAYLRYEFDNFSECETLEEERALQDL